jgi:glucose/arabinose transport system ATP-binding protein
MVKIKLENITKIFGKKGKEFKALDDVSFEIPGSSFYGVLGASGAGKTTVMRIIAGLETPTMGKLYFDDELVAADNKDLIPVETRNVGMVFQNWALYPHLSNYENIAFPLKVRHWTADAINSRINELAEILGIKEIIHKRPGQVSGGQQQRVAVARALAKNPALLLLDEPFSNLDANSKDDARSLVREVQKSLGVTAVIVSHDPSDIFSLAQEVAVISLGTLGQVSSPGELYDYPKNVKVASTLGEINFVDASISKNGGSYTLVIADDVKISGVEFKGSVSNNTDRIKVGIRPEDLAVHKVGEKKDITMDEDWLPIGEFKASSSNYSQGNFMVTLQDKKATMKINALSREVINPDDMVKLYVNQEKIKFFDPVSGERISS